MKPFILFLSLISLTSFLYSQSPKNYDCFRAKSTIIIDGDVYKDVWKTIPWSDFFVDIEGKASSMPYYESRMKMLWDDNYLYIAAELEEKDIWGYLENHDEIIYRDNDFEVFIDPTGDGLNYFEIEINTLETVLDIYLNKPYNKGGRADLTWNAEGLLKAVKIYGSANDTTSSDVKWTVELAIPWDIYQNRDTSVLSPVNGTTWRMNFSRVEWEYEFADGRYNRKTEPETGKRYPENNWVWSPQGVINMHAPEMWGYVTFINELPQVNQNQWSKGGLPLYWTWMGGNSNNERYDWERIMRKMDDAGIRGFLFGGNVTLLNKVIQIAKQYNIKVHAWYWTMNRGDAKPHWLSYNQLGNSLAYEKAYVDYYKFMCPALPEVQEFIKSGMDDLAEVDGLEGIHMDYIRYVDVILPVGLQPKYGLVQDHIMPEFDYGYHPYMRGLYKDKYGVDPIELKDPGNNKSWIDFRLNQLNLTIDELRNHVKGKDMKITAAVFPTPQMSADMVRQDWKDWNLDCYFPMVYHNFYNEDIDWIREVIEEDRKAIGDNSMIFCGLYLPSLQGQNSVSKAINAALAGGADGISFFSYGNLNENTIVQIKNFTKKHR